MCQAPCQAHLVKRHDARSGWGRVTPVMEVRKLPPARGMWVGSDPAPALLLSLSHEGGVPPRRIVPIPTRELSLGVLPCQGGTCTPYLFSGGRPTLPTLPRLVPEACRCPPFIAGKLRTLRSLKTRHAPPPSPFPFWRQASPALFCPLSVAMRGPTSPLSRAQGGSSLGRPLPAPLRLEACTDVLCRQIARPGGRVTRDASRRDSGSFLWVAPLLTFHRFYCISCLDGFPFLLKSIPAWL